MTLRPIDMSGETPRAAPAGERPDLEWVPAARGICSAGYARELVALFRAQGCLPRVLGIGGVR